MDYLQLKKKHWIERNSIKENIRYITKLLNHYNLTDYEFVNADEDIVIKYKNNNYRVFMDKDNMSYKLFKDDEILKEINGDDIIFEMIQIILEEN